MRVEREFVLLGPPNFILLGDDLSSAAHVIVFKGTPQTVINHCVNEFAVSHPVTFARFEKQVRGIAHRFHSAGDHHLRIAELDALRCQHHCLQPRTADLVYRDSRNRRRQTSTQRCLSRRVLAQARLNYATHNYFVNLFCLDSCPLNAFTHHDCPQLGSRKPFQ